MKLKADTEEKEYRAKLSEVALVDHPRLALGSILTMDGDSPHARANRRIGRQLIEWMKNHRDEIQGLEAIRPLLPQLDRLTNDQLRAAFAAMDPLVDQDEQEPLDPGADRAVDPLVEVTDPEHDRAEYGGDHESRPSEDVLEARQPEDPRTLLDQAALEYSQEDPERVLVDVVEQQGQVDALGRGGGQA